MRAGDLRHRVAIQEDQGEVVDANGAKTPSWKTLRTVWASVEPLSGREFFQAAQTQSQTSHRVRIRYVPGLTTKHRFLFGERVLNIDRILNKDERNIEQECMCVEVGS